MHICIIVAICVGNVYFVVFALFPGEEVLKTVLDGLAPHGCTR